MKIERKPIASLPHKWKYGDPLREYVVIDWHNSNFHEGDGLYNAICKVVYTKKGAQIRFNNVIYVLWEDD